jgi:hypothetical protein
MHTLSQEQSLARARCRAFYRMYLNVGALSPISSISVGDSRATTALSNFSRRSFSLASIHHNIPASTMPNPTVNKLMPKPVG